MIKCISTAMGYCEEGTHWASLTDVICNYFVDKKRKFITTIDRRGEGLVVGRASVEGTVVVFYECGGDKND